jgi:hypothetical protein
MVFHTISFKYLQFGCQGIVAGCAGYIGPIKYQGSDKQGNRKNKDKEGQNTLTSCHFEKIHEENAYSIEHMKSHSRDQENFKRFQQWCVHCIQNSRICFLAEDKRDAVDEYMYWKVNDDNKPSEPVDKKGPLTEVPIDIAVLETI